MRIKRKIITTALLQLVMVSSLAQMANKQRTAEYIWQYRGMRLGKIIVPSGYQAQTENYREGIVTYLKYQNGAQIVLQRGSLYRVPMFQQENYELEQERQTAEKVIRKGRYLDNKLYWGEHNYKFGKTADEKLKLLERMPPNIGFIKVPEKMRTDFEQALDSFSQK